MSTLRRAARLTYDVAAQLEDRGRELQRVLPLPAGPPAAQQADAVRPGRGLRRPTDPGRAAGWRSPTAARRCRSSGRRDGRPLLYARDETEARRDLLLHPVAEPDRVGPPGLRADAPGVAGRPEPVASSTATSTSRRTRTDTDRRHRRRRVLGHHQPRGLPRGGAAAAGDPLAQLDGRPLLQPGGLGPRVRHHGRGPLRERRQRTPCAAGGRRPRASAASSRRSRAADVADVPTLPTCRRADEADVADVRRRGRRGRRCRRGRRGRHLPGHSERVAPRPGRPQPDRAPGGQ